MRQLCEIMADLKDGKEVDYEEARLSCLVLSNINFQLRQDVKHLLSENRLVIEIVKSSYSGMPDGMSKMYWKAMHTSPEEFLGMYHPDNPEQKKFMEFGNKVLEHVLSNMDKTDHGR